MSLFQLQSLTSPDKLIHQVQPSLAATPVSVGFGWEFIPVALPPLLVPPSVPAGSSAARGEQGCGRRSWGRTGCGRGGREGNALAFPLTFACFPFTLFALQFCPVLSCWRIFSTPGNTYGQV